MKTYFGTPTQDYVWLEIDNNKLFDLAVGNHYAGCRCTLTKHPLEKCNGFNSCLNSVLKQMYLYKPHSYTEVKQIIGEQYKDIFDKVENK
jgi:hypothetical protein